MTSWMRIVSLLGLAGAIAGLGCGGAQPEAKTTPGDTTPTPGPTDTDSGTTSASTAPAATAEQQIRDWLGARIGERLSALGEKLGADAGRTLGQNPQVLDQARKLGKTIFDAPEVKKRLDKLEEESTAGMMRKIQLGMLVLAAGGVDDYKKQVKAKAQAIAADAVAEYLRTRFFKDPRAAKAIGGLGPAFKAQATVTAAGIQENLSAESSKKLLGIALRLSAAGGGAEMARRVEAWTGSCVAPADKAAEELLTGVANLPALQKALVNLISEILAHPTMIAELTATTAKLMDDAKTHKAYVAAYELIAFNAPEAEIRSKIDAILALPETETGLFAAMERLALRPGAAAILERHTSAVAQDPELAKLIEKFIVAVLDSCGDPTKFAASTK